MAEAGLSEYFPFIHKYSRIEDVLKDKDLASLGDAFMNFAYSLALSKNSGRPAGRKLDGSILSLALRKSGLRKLLPHRVDRHGQADAAEALIVYGWLSGIISIKETIDILAREGDLADNVSGLLMVVLERCKNILA
ncbi:MAG: ribonuclease III family protein [Candidatus Bathyarchaeia archaeon]